MPKTKHYWLQEYWTHVQIESLSYYLDKLHTQLEDMAEQFKEWMKSEAQKLPDGEEKEEFLQSQAIDSWYHEEVFPRLFLNSFYLTAYSLLETEICSIANQIGKKQEQKFDLSEIRGGKHLGPAIYYIKKLTSIDAKQFSCWNGLKDGQELRNIIAHSNGKVTERKDIDLAKRCRVYDTSRKEVRITHDYCESFIKLLKTFFGEIYKQMEAGNFL